MIKLYIDNREHKLCKLLPDATILALDVGDIQFRKDGDIVLVIERKTLADLAASIRDGRSREQKARLLNCGIARERVMYLIEGTFPISLTTKVGRMPTNTLLGSIINMQLRDGITVHKTSSVEETAVFISKMLAKLNKDGDDYWKYASENGITAEKYSSTLKKKKKANMTPEVWLISQLSLIPQVTSIIASVIHKVYPTLKDLVLEYEKIPETLRDKLLADLKYTLSTGKERRIGPKVSKRIYCFVYGVSDK